MFPKLACALVGIPLFCLPAQAYTVTTGGSSILNNGQSSLVVGAITVDFNTGAAPTAGIAQYNSATANVVLGSSSGQYASPPNDTTRYFSIGPSTVSTATINFTQSINYFGFFAGSLDDYNLIQFFTSTGSTTLSGTDLATMGGFAATGNQTQGLYINILATTNNEVFTKIIFSSVTNAFETDNHAYRIGTTAVLTVPEPSPLPALVALGLALISVKVYKSRAVQQDQQQIH